MKYSTALVMQTYMTECINGNISKEELGEELLNYIENHIYKIRYTNYDKKFVPIDSKLILEVFKEEKWLMIQVEYLSIDELKELYPNPNLLNPITHRETIGIIANINNYSKLTYLFNPAAIRALSNYDFHGLGISVTEDYCYKYGKEALEFMESKASARWNNTFIFDVHYDIYHTYLEQAKLLAEPFRTNAINLNKEMNLNKNEFVRYDYNSKLYVLSHVYGEEITSETPEGLKEEYVKQSRSDRF